MCKSMVFNIHIKSLVFGSRREKTFYFFERMTDNENKMFAMVKLDSI